MQFRKIAAVAGSALMTGMTLASAAMAATNVGNIAELAKPSDSVANFPIFVIGKTAQTEDVAGAVDIAVRMAAESKTTTTATTTTTSGTVTGVDRDGIRFGTIASGDALSTAISGGAAFPNSGIVLTTHFSGLKDSTFSHRGTDYDYKEQVDVSAVRMRHDLATDKINGSEKMVIGTNGDVKYEYVFDKSIWINNTVAGAGTIASPEYTNAIKIKLLGKDFSIVGIGTNSIKMLTGTVGTAKKQGTTVTGITSGDYTVYVTAAANNDWASFEIKDKTGNVVDTISGVTEGNSKDSSATGLTIKVSDSRVSGTDPATQIVEADIVVGKTGFVEKEYDSTADVDSTGTSNEAFDSANPRWGIQFSQTGTAAQTADGRQIITGSKIQVVYKPTEKQYLKPGEKVVLPNNYAELGFTGWNTDTFAKITVEPSGQVSAYNVTDKALVGASFYGLKLSSDKSGVFKAGGNFFTTAYLLLNATGGVATTTLTGPVAVGYKDETSGKILINDSFRGGRINETYQEVPYGWAKLNLTTANVDSSTHSFTYNYTINAGEQDFILNVLIDNTTRVISNMTVGTGTASGTGGTAGATLQLSFQNKSAWAGGAGAADLSTELFRLGPTASSAEATDINVTTEAAIGNAGAKTQDEIVDDSGIILVSPSTYTASDKVVFKVPSKALAVKAYFGTKGAATSTDGTTTDKVISVTTDVVKLDTEMTDAVKTGNNLVLVGGPCVNTLVASLATDGKFDYKCDASAAGTQPEWPAENFGIVKVVQDAFATGKVAVVVAGTRAADTKLASLAIQSGKLAGNNATSAKLTGADINSLVVS